MVAKHPKQQRMYHAESVLMRRTRELLTTTNIRYFQIYEDLGIQPAWLTQFKKGNIPDPSVNRVEALYNYLSGNVLAVE